MNLRSLFSRSKPAQPETPAAGQERSAPIIRPRGHALKTSRAAQGVALRMFAEAAQDNNMTAKWTSTPTSVDAYIYQHWLKLVARSRDQGEVSDHGRKFLQLCRDNIAGPNGFKMSSQSADVSGNHDQVACKAIEDAWKAFGKQGVFDVTKGMSRAAFEKLLVTTVARDGEVFVIKRMGSRWEHGAAFQMVDPMMISPTDFRTLQNGNKVKHGIEFDEFDCPVAYWFMQYSETQAGYVLNSSASRWERIEAQDVIHIYLREFAGQKRGLPWMRTGLMRMRQLAAFETAATVHARIGASNMGFFRSDSGDELEPEDLPVEVEPGTFADIGDRTFEQFNPQFPDAFMGVFQKTILQSLAAGLNVSYTSLSSDLSAVSFSSIRQGTLDEREIWKGLQQFFIDSWCLVGFEFWLEAALLKGVIVVPKKNGGQGALPYAKLEKYKPVKFTGRRWQWVDPKSDVEANATEVGQGLKSRTQVIEENGGDAEETWQQIQRENELLKKYGVEIQAMPGAGAAGKTKDSQQNQK